MNILMLKAFWPEIFFSISIICILIFNAVQLNDLKNKFPILNNEIYFQVYTILFFVFLLFLNNGICIFDKDYYFIHDLTSQNTKIAVSGFFLLFFGIIWRAFLIERLNFFEYFIILLLAVLALFLLSSAYNLLSIYLCLELQSMCFYVLSAFNRTSPFSSESGFKYFVSSSVFSGLFLLGCAFFFGGYGTLNLHAISIFNETNLIESSSTLTTFISVGCVFIIIVFLFKLVIAPFHVWFPQIYDGAPLSSTIAFTTLPKIVVFTVFLRFWSAMLPITSSLQDALFFVGVISIFFGIWKAMQQKRLKKLYIYSSISQMGLPLCALTFCAVNSFTIVYFFLFIYLITSVIMWSTFVLLNSNQHIAFAGAGEKTLYSVYISSLKNLSVHNAALAFVFLALLFSLAGIPPFAGFLSKVYVYCSLISEQKYEIAALVIYISSFGVYYYIKLLKIIFYENKALTYHAKEQSLFNSPNLDLDCLILAFTMFLLLFLCFYPNMVFLYAAQFVPYFF